MNTTKTHLFTAAILTLTLASIAPAQIIIGPAPGNTYTWTITDQSYVDIGAARTVIWNGAAGLYDDRTADIPIGFSFRYYGNSYSSIRVSTNGYLTFAPETGTSLSNDAMPDTQAPNNIIAPWWDDLKIDNIGTPDEVSYIVTGIAGFRTLTIQYRSVSLYQDTSTNHNFLYFQVKLREFGDHISFIYGSYLQVGSPLRTPLASLGIENASGTVAAAPFPGSPALTAADWPTGKGITFSPARNGDYTAELCTGSYSFLGSGRTTIFSGATGLHDDQSDDISIGFPFEFYGQTFTTLRVSTNGYATFPPASGTDFSNDPIGDAANPSPILAPWFDDLKVAMGIGANDEISYEFNGFLPGQRWLRVQWSSMSRYGDTAANHSYLNFQVHLYEDGNRIEFHYGPNGTFGTPNDFTASLGIHDDTADLAFAPFGYVDNLNRADFLPSSSIICLEPAFSAVCGDCTGNGLVSITDALFAAQHGVGIITLTGTDFAACNINGAPGGTGTVDVLDALDIARHNVGVLPSLSCSP